MKKIAASLAAVLAATSMSACSFNFSLGETKVKAAEVEAKILPDLKAKTAQDATVKCPGDLAGKVGATLTCNATVKGKQYPVNVSVTSAEGKDVRFSWELGKPAGQETTEPTSAPTPTRAATTAPPSATPSSTSTGGSGAVPADTLREWVKEDVTKKDPKYATAVVDCQGSLRTQVGATQECRVTHASGTLLLTVTVTGVEGDRVRYKFTEH